MNDFLRNRSSHHFSALYDQFTPSLIRTALYLVRNERMQADDMVQETWITAVERLEQFRWESSLKTWLTGILMNKFREASRQSKPADDIESAQHATAGTPRHDLAMDLKSVIMRLPEGYKEILLMHDLEGFKHREIATVLCIDEGTSKSQLFNARKVMRSMLQAYKH